MMKRYAALAVLSISIITLDGCAKRELTKKDESISSTTKQAGEATLASTEARVTLQPAQTRQPLQKVETEQPTVQPVLGAAELKAVLERVYFNFDSPLLSGEARDILAKNAELIKHDGVARVLIEGNCDERGSDEYNLALGEKRAKAARQYLVTMGVPAERLSVISYGKEKPRDPGHGENAWAKNRRDEFVIVE